ncbi:MAG: Gfo/Idh/MocA family oxidoreductase [Phycisphaerae bacterium]|nr:Gfo/Idh/MocA family oxidoreductase [Phycisphaerae bacterium]
MTHITRRQFVGGSVAAGLGMALAGCHESKGPVLSPSSRVLGANDEIRVAVVGINGRGGSHISAFEEMEGVRVAAFCDVDRKVLDDKATAFEKKYGHAVDKYVDIRKLLEDKNIDAISIATPNHWHSLGTIWACQAGKDVYVEKPCSHNVFEGRKCVEAARKYGRIVQHGTQSRSSKGWARQVAAIASGKYGKLLVSKGAASKNGSGRWSIGFKPITEPPANLDYNLWLGPAQETPYHANLVHYNWHWFWSFGNGEIGNQGVHQMDIARWAIPGATLPRSVISLGGRWVESTEGHPPFTDQAQTPNCQLTIMDFGGPLLVFEVIGLVGREGADGKKYPTNVGNEFYLEAGTIRGGKFYAKGSDQAEELAVPEPEMDTDHFGNFIRAMRSRKVADLNADIEQGHLASACCHLGNISYRLGQQVPGTTKPDVLGRHEEIGRSWDRILETVKGAIGLDVTKGTFQLGPMLTFDPAKEKFKGHRRAPQLLTRAYRSPFVVPEQV